jgi:hypothetical protein
LQKTMTSIKVSSWSLLPCRYVKVWCEYLWLYSVPEGVWRRSAFSLDISLCNLLLWLSFGLVSVISSCDELYLVPSLLIDHGNESSFRGVLLIYYRVTLNRVYFCQISGCEQPSNMSQITADTKSQ